MKIKPMTMSTAEKELATTDLDGTRKYLDEISYNIRGIFHGDHSETDAPELKPVDIAEHLMDAMDVLTYGVEKLTAFEVSEEELHKINSIITSLRYFIESARSTGIELRSSITEEYYEMFLYKLDDLIEVVDDAESIFFDLRRDKDFMASVNKLFGLR